MSRTTDKIDKRIISFLQANVTPVTVAGVQGLFNHKCHLNSVQFSKENPGHSVVMGICSDGVPVLHFWVVDQEAKHKDVTLGWLAEENVYYPMRVLNDEEWGDISSIFNQGLNYWRDSQANWFERNIIRVKRVV